MATCVTSMMTATMTTKNPMATEVSRSCWHYKILKVSVPTSQNSQVGVLTYSRLTQYFLYVGLFKAYSYTFYCNIIKLLNLSHPKYIASLWLTSNTGLVFLVYAQNPYFLSQNARLDVDADL